MSDSRDQKTVKASQGQGGIRKTVKARFWPCLSGKILQTIYVFPLWLWLWSRLKVWHRHSLKGPAGVSVITVKQIWHIYDNQRHSLTLATRTKSCKPCK